MPAIMLLVGLSTCTGSLHRWHVVDAGRPGISVGNIAEFTFYVNKLTWPFASLGMITSKCSRPR
jgi:hypothetical protein